MSTTNTLTLGASVAASKLIGTRPDLDFTAASSTRKDGKLSVKDARAFIKRMDSNPNPNTPPVADFISKDARTWGINADKLSLVDTEAVKADDKFQKASGRLDHTMLELTALYAAGMGIKSGVEPGESKLAPFTPGMKKAFPEALKRKAFGPYASVCKKMLAFGVIPNETKVRVPCVRYTPPADKSEPAVKTLEYNEVVVDNISVWKADSTPEKIVSKAGLWMPAISKVFDDDKALRDCERRIAGQKNEPASEGDKGSDITKGLNPAADVGLITEIADVLRLATKAHCLERARSILADAVAAVEAECDAKAKAS